jgi:hypothetical protein
MVGCDVSDELYGVSGAQGRSCTIEYVKSNGNFK